jgi:hypothetical protein
MELRRASIAFIQYFKQFNFNGFMYILAANIIFLCFKLHSFYPNQFDWILFAI